MTATAPHPRLDELIATLERLRAPGGCAWDREQTHASLVQYLVEESYELVEAIEHGTREDLVEELGDVLYQVLFHADIAAEAGVFTLEDVAAQMTAKMVGRHPHVFGDAQARTAEEVTVRWDELKRAEKPARTSVLDGIPQAMPALQLAAKVLGRAAKVGVVLTADAGRDADVVHRPGPAAPGADRGADDAERELGDRMLAMVAESRASGLDAERALRGALRRLQDDVRAAEAAQTA